MIIGVSWAIAVVIVFSLLLRRRVRTYARRHDERARRDLVEAIMLFIAAWATAAAIVLVVLGPQGTGIRALSVGIAWGAFLAYGVIVLTEPDNDPVVVDK